MNRHSRIFCILTLLCLVPLARAQDARLTDDSYTTSAAPTTTHGAAPSLFLIAPTLQAPNTNLVYLKFDLSTLPAGTTGASIAKANLILWVTSDIASGMFDIHRLTGAWNEKSLTALNAPPIGSTDAAGVPIVANQQFIVVDLTPLVQDWLNGVLPNNGIQLKPSAGSAVNVGFDSKENTGTGHQPRLDILLTGPAGAQGPAGAAGPQGPQGSIGPMGFPGAQGPQGATGPAGSAGPIGATGPAGAQGSAGAQGATGPAGSMGASGPAGPAGSPGQAGATGMTGPAGPAGVDGAPGPQGPTGPTGSPGPQGPAGPGGLDPALLGSLRWDVLRGDFGVGTLPSGVAFDGANIWVANFGGNSVTKLRASDGANLGTFPVGQGPVGIAYGVGVIWVANYTDNTVSGLDPGSGAPVLSFNVGKAPHAIVFAAGAIWTANYGDGTVTKFVPFGGVNTYTVGGQSASGMAFDGTFIWVTDPLRNKVWALQASDGTPKIGSPFGNVDHPAGIAFDGTNIWVAIKDVNLGGGVTKLSIDGACVATCTFYLANSNVLGIAFDGTNIWLAMFDSNAVMKLRPSDAANLGIIAVGTHPLALAFDGSSMWIANQGSNTISRR